MQLTAEQIANDFSTSAPGLSLVTVSQVDPDTGTAMATTTDVTALKRVTHRVTTQVGGGGEVGATLCRFLLRADEIGFEPRERDRITDAEGIIWEVGNVDVIGFGALVVCDGCVRKRVDR